MPRKWSKHESKGLAAVGDGNDSQPPGDGNVFQKGKFSAGFKSK